MEKIEFSGRISPQISLMQLYTLKFYYFVFFIIISKKRFYNAIFIIYNALAKYTCSYKFIENIQICYTIVIFYNKKLIDKQKLSIIKIIYQIKDTFI